MSFIKKSFSYIRVFIFAGTKIKKEIFLILAFVIISVIVKQYVMALAILILSTLFSAYLGREKMVKTQLKIEMLEEEKRYIEEEIARYERLINFGNPTEEEVERLVFLQEEKRDIQKRLDLNIKQKTKQDKIFTK